MRLYQIINIQENLKQRNFTEFLLKIRDDTYLIIQGIENIIKLSSKIVILKENLTDFINFIYSNLAKNFDNIDYIVSRVILTPKNVDIKKISDMVIDQFLEEAHIYSNANMMTLTEDNDIEQPQLYSFKFLRSLKISDLSLDELKLKVGVLIILL